MKKKHEFNFNSFKDADAILRNNALDEERQNKMREGILVETGWRYSGEKTLENS